MPRPSLRLSMILPAILALVGSGCRSSEPSLKRSSADGPPPPARFSRTGVPDSMILKPQTDGGFGSGPP